MSETQKSILLITTTHLAKNPRLVKEIKALKTDFKVTVIFFQTINNMCKFDLEIIDDNPDVDFTIINWIRKYSFERFFYTLFNKFLNLVCKVFKLDIFPEQRYFAGHIILLRKVLENKPHIIHGHNPAALPVVVKAAKVLQCKCSFDAEDYHRGEFVNTDHPYRKLITKLEDKYLVQLDNFITSSPLINKEYKKNYPGLNPTCILNVFSKNNEAFYLRKEDSLLKLVWFSQIIGLDRGLQSVIKGINKITSISIQFDIVGLGHPDTIKSLRLCLTNKLHHLNFLGVLSPKILEDTIKDYDIGVASEPSKDLNNAIALSNKLFTYLRSGIALLVSDTPAQKDFLTSVSKPVGLLYQLNSDDSVKDQLNKWITNKNFLLQHKRNAHALNQEEFNWEIESQKLINCFIGDALIRNINQKSLKIAITVDPEIPLPPTHYGGIERIVFMLITELIKKGHQITLFAHPNSKVPCELIGWKGKKSWALIPTLKNALQLNQVLSNHDFDLVHSFSRLAYFSLILGDPLPKIMSYQREPTLIQVKRAIKLAKKNTLFITGCSNYITSQVSKFAPSKTVYNGVSLHNYQSNQNVETDAPLVYLGRIESIKGVHLAIETAVKSQRKLLIAGNIPKEGKSYFNDKIKPYLNKEVVYIGPVDDVKKNELLRNASALLMPILWNEPFGIVMIEAMACGTPVIAFNRGSIPEVITHGENGFICENVNEMVEYVKLIPNLNRQRIRQLVEENFSAEVITNNYLKIYHQLILN